MATGSRLLLDRWRYGRYLDILVTHAAPYGVRTAPTCVTGVPDLPLADGPVPARYLLHGHIHAAQRGNGNRYRDTQVLNAFRWGDRGDE